MMRGKGPGRKWRRYLQGGTWGPLSNQTDEVGGPRLISNTGQSVYVSAREKGEEATQLAVIYGRRGDLRSGFY